MSVLGKLKACGRGMCVKGWRLDGFVLRSTIFAAISKDGLERNGEKKLN